MITDKIKELASAKEKIAALEESIAADLRRELATLPTKYGFDSAAEFISAIKDATASQRGRRANSKGTMPKRRTRAVITDETKADVKKMVEADKTGAEIAKTLGISLPSVQNIKKTLGLVKPRTKS